MLQVFIFRDGRFFGTECFAQGQIIMGRSPDVDLQLDDDITSRSHASVEVSPEGLILEDLASSNGTYVNGEPIERCYLSSRDEVSIGAYTLKFKLLNRNKPRAQFRDETRVVSREDHAAMAAQPAPSERDETEVVDSERLRAVRDGPGSQPPIREAEAQPGMDIAAALSEELEGEPSADFDSPSTARLERPPEAVRAEPASQAGDFESTQIEREPRAEPPPEPELQDQSTRWLTPDPDQAPPLQLAGEPSAELQPEPPPAQAVPPEPAQAAPPEPSHLAPPEPAPVEPPRVREPLSAGVHEGPTDAELGAAPGLDPLASPVVPAGEIPGETAGPAVTLEALDEEEAEEAQPDFVEPFSLLNNLIRENFTEPQVPTTPQPVMEVITYSSDKEVLGYQQIERGKKYRMPGDRFVLAHYNDNAAGRLQFMDGYSGGVISGGQTVPLDDLKDRSNQVGKRKKQPVYGYKLMKGDYANVIHEGGGSFVRFVNPPHVPPARFQFKLDPLDLKIFGGSFLGLALMIFVLGLLAGKQEAAAAADLDRFAKVSMKDLEMEKPEEEVEVPLDELPEPEKQEEEKAEEPKEEEQPKEKPKKKPKRRPRRRARKKAGGGGSSGGGAGMMAALGNLNKKKSSSNVVTAVTNLDAVRVPGGRSRYKVSGLVTKLPSSSVVTSRGKGVGVKGGIDMLRGGKGRGGRAGIGPGALGGGRAGKRKVGGVVFKAPKRRMRKRGSLSREAIARVVRRHLKQIQYCYEKSLMLNPKLAGKVIMEWTINTSGKVTVVKTKRNTMASPAVAMCISANIKKWKFPKPKGGIVVVSYPFIFNSIGF